jgi:hypothetical protein
MTRQIVFCLITILFFSCHHKTENIPSDADVEQAIKEMYAHMSSADGGGGYHINNIEIIEKRPAKEPNHYFVKVKASGAYVSPPLADPKPDKDYSETREEELIYENGKWGWYNQYQL